VAFKPDREVHTKRQNRTNAQKSRLLKSKVIMKWFSDTSLHW